MQLDAGIEPEGSHTVCVTIINTHYVISCRRMRVRTRNPFGTDSSCLLPSFAFFLQLRRAVAPRDLTQFESDMLVYPRLCNVCLDGRQVSQSLSLLCNCIVQRAAYGRGKAFVDTKLETSPTKWAAGQLQ